MLYLTSTEDPPLLLLLFFLLPFASSPFSLFYFISLFSLLSMLFFLMSVFRILSRKISSYYLLSHIKNFGKFFPNFSLNLLRKFPSFARNPRKETIPFNSIFSSFSSCISFSIFIWRNKWKLYLGLYTSKYSYLELQVSRNPDFLLMDGMIFKKHQKWVG